MRGAPAPGELSLEQLVALLEDFDAREVLHATFGSARATLESALKATLRAHEQAYFEVLERHFYRRLAPFT